jgi:hypothetical protein
MKLSPDKERFLRRWMYDEVHLQEGRGPAKQLQLEHSVVPSDLAILIAAAMPDLAQQEAAGLTCAPGMVVWPWSNAALESRLEEAHAALATAERTYDRTSVSGGK